MLVSIIIPTFNQGKYLRECIVSALNQDISQNKVEVIVVNDGSSDDTSDICMEFADRIKYVYKQNGGTASALNAGITMAKGEYIHWLSSDDVMLDNAINHMLHWIDENDRGNAPNTIYYTNYHVIDDRGLFLRDFKEPGHPESKLWDFFFGNGSTTLIHREIFEKIGDFDSGLPHSEDYEFWLRATMLHDINMRLIPLFTINYRNHSEQLTNKVGGSLDKAIKIAIRERMG
jgi:glycosyltransferase involved in cell wall biosynthesis